MPSIHDEPINEPRQVNPERLWLYEAVGASIVSAIQTVPLELAHTHPDSYRLKLGEHVLRQLKNKGCLVHKDGEIVNLSRYADKADPVASWLDYV